MLNDEILLSNIRSSIQNYIYCHNGIPPDIIVVSADIYFRLQSYTEVNYNSGGELRLKLCGIDLAVSTNGEKWFSVGERIWSE